MWKAAMDGLHFYIEKIVKRTRVCVWCLKEYSVYEYSYWKGYVLLYIFLDVIVKVFNCYFFYKFCILIHLFLPILNSILTEITVELYFLAFKRWHIFSKGEALCQQTQYYIGSGKTEFGPLSNNSSCICFEYSQKCWNVWADNEN